MDHSSPATQVATGRDWQRSTRVFATVAALMVPFFLLLRSWLRTSGGRCPRRTSARETRCTG